MCKELVDIVELMRDIIKIFSLRRQLNFMCFLCIIYIVNSYFKEDIKAFTGTISEFIAEFFPDFYHKIYIILNSNFLYNTTKMITRFNLVVFILFIIILTFQLLINKINVDFVTRSGIQYNLDTLGVLLVTSFNIYIDILIINEILFSSKIFNVFLFNEEYISIISLSISGMVSFILILGMLRYGISIENES